MWSHGQNTIVFGEAMPISVGVTGTKIRSQKWKLQESVCQNELKFSENSCEPHEHFGQVSPAHTPSNKENSRT